MALKSHDSVPGEVLKFLQDLGCCFRCSLRFGGVRNSEDYQSEEQEHDEPNGKAFKCNPCIACIGLAQELDYNDGVDCIKEAILKSGYDAETFTCALSFPVSLLLREHAIWLKLLKEFPDIYANLIKIEHVTSLKDVWRFVNGDKLQKKVGKKISFTLAPLQVHVNVLYKDDETECSCLVNMTPEKFRHRYRQTKIFKQIFTRNGVQSILSDLSDETFKKHYDLAIPGVPFHYGDVVCQHSSLYIAGRYNKFSRKLSQTPWIIDGKKHMETSTQELITCYLEPFFKVATSKFSSSGREDVDVRMLGRGRPFALELIDPHHTKCDLEEMKHLQNQINSSTQDIAVHHLQLVAKEQLSQLKDGEENKTKCYSALCVLLDGGTVSESEIKLLSQSDIVLMQKTPLRVLHRRPLAVRKRTIFKMEPILIPHKPNYFVLKLETQAGTYIKEFIHGDFNRTTPNLCEILGREIDIVALDVDDVTLEWPPSMP